ncbi:hypothetical protein BDFB_012708, partial [Asbolus verrucosus]
GSAIRSKQAIERVPQSEPENSLAPQSAATSACEPHVRRNQGGVRLLTGLVSRAAAAAGGPQDGRAPCGGGLGQVPPGQRPGAADRCVTFLRQPVGSAGRSMGPARSSGRTGRRPGRSHVERDRRDTVTNRRCDVSRSTLTANLHAAQGGIQRLLVALGEGRGPGTSAHCKYSWIATVPQTYHISC